MHACTFLRGNIVSQRSSTNLSFCLWNVPVFWNNCLFFLANFLFTNTRRAVGKEKEERESVGTISNYKVCTQSLSLGFKISTILISRPISYIQYQIFLSVRNYVRTYFVGHIAKLQNQLIFYLFDQRSVFWTVYRVLTVNYKKI